jgi:hypothetical protein
MGCSLKNFTVGKWKKSTVQGHKFEIAKAATTGLKLRGVVYSLDGVFQGFTGNEEAAIYWVGEKLKEQTAAV